MQTQIRSLALLLVSAFVSGLAPQSLAANTPPQKPGAAKRTIQSAGSSETTAWLDALKSAKAGNPQAVRAVLSFMKNRDGMASAEFSLQLYEVFSRHPALVISQSKVHFAGDMKCLAYWLIPASQEVEFSEVRSVMDRALAKTTSEDVKSFSRLIDAYYAAIEKETPMPVESCARFFYGPKKN